MTESLISDQANPGSDPMHWSEPVLVRYDFELGPTSSPANVCLGFPQRVEERRWTCAFQFQDVGRDDAIS